MSKSLIIKGGNFINHINFDSFKIKVGFGFSLSTWKVQMPTLYVNKIIIPPIPIFDYTQPGTNTNCSVYYNFDFYSNGKQIRSFKNLSSLQENTLVMNCSFEKQRGDYVCMSVGELKNPDGINRNNLRISVFSPYSGDADLIDLLGECKILDVGIKYVAITGEWFYL